MNSNHVKLRRDPTRNARAIATALVADVRGANLVEYIMLVGLIAILCIVGFQLFGSAIRAKITAQTGTLNSIQETAQ